MGNELVLLLTVFVLAIFVGFEIITKVPPTLHTPLMSGSNAISGITLVGALISTGAGNEWLATSLGVPDKLSGRHQLLAIAALAASAVLGLGLSTAAWWMRRAIRCASPTIWPKTSMPPTRPAMSVWRKSTPTPRN